MKCTFESFKFSRNAKNIINSVDQIQGFNEISETEQIHIKKLVEEVKPTYDKILQKNSNKNKDTLFMIQTSNAHKASEAQS